VFEQLNLLPGFEIGMTFMYLKVSM